MSQNSQWRGKGSNQTSPQYKYRAAPLHHAMRSAYRTFPPSQQRNMICLTKDCDAVTRGEGEQHWSRRRRVNEQARH
jgi:hypothetical protein